MKIKHSIILVALSLTSSCIWDKEELAKPSQPADSLVVVVCDTSKVTFCAKVEAIINSNCAVSGCHSNNSSFGDFTSYDGIKTVVYNGSLKTRVLIDKDMPPSLPLSDTDRQLIDDWLTAGAPER